MTTLSRFIFTERTFPSPIVGGRHSSHAALGSFGSRLPYCQPPLSSSVCEALGFSLIHCADATSGLSSRAPISLYPEWLLHFKLLDRLFCIPSTPVARR